MRSLVNLPLAVIITACLATDVAAENLSLDDLLENVQAGRIQDSKNNQSRIAAFRASKGRQQQLLAEARAELASEEARSETLETAFEEIELKIVELEHALKERLGSLKELFGVLQQASGDARGQFENSPTQVQFPGRAEFLTGLAQKMGQTSRLASLEEIRRLWYELQREITESGKVVRFKTNVITSTGDEIEQEVIRVGAFNVVSNGRYLKFEPATGHLVELARQPQQRYLDKVAGLEAATKGTAPVSCGMCLTGGTPPTRSRRR